MQVRVLSIAAGVRLKKSALAGDVWTWINYIFPIVIKASMQFRNRSRCRDFRKHLWMRCDWSGRGSSLPRSFLIGHLIVIDNLLEEVKKKKKPMGKQRIKLKYLDICGHLSNSAVAHWTAGPFKSAHRPPSMQLNQSNTCAPRMVANVNKSRASMFSVPPVYFKIGPLFLSQAPGSCFILRFVSLFSPRVFGSSVCSDNLFLYTPNDISRYLSPSTGTQLWNWMSGPLPLSPMVCTH